MMGQYRLKIELLSDMCVSDGGVYNSSLDIDICHDSLGFPYIPARRIKGCLRECAQELNDWGEKIPVETLFGDKGADSNRAKVRIGDALLKDYEQMKRLANEYRGNLVFHSQNVLDHYSYVRTQTAMDYNTGVADPASLRTMRVVNKGLIFYAEIEMEDGFFKDMGKCCDVFTNIGVGRTRGLGEIAATLEKDPDNGNTQENKDVCVSYVPGATRLDYELLLEEPMICKSTNGGESRSIDYIEGSKMLGLIAQELKKQRVDFVGFMGESELFCSNAYHSVDGVRCLEAPANDYSFKNDSEHYFEITDRASLEPEQEQISDEDEEKPDFLKRYQEEQSNRIKHGYVRRVADGSLARESVGIEERYHHRRPEDKSIGRAVKDSSGDSHFYQISSIEAGQRFRGYVTGSEAQIKRVYDSLSRLRTIYLGYSHSSEYGKTRIRVTGLCEKQPMKEQTLRDFVVKLESPAIIYNDYAFYSTDVADLDKEIRFAFGLGDRAAKIDRHVNYTTVGGYNVTWDARKPMVEAFDKGTVLVYHLEEPCSVMLPEQILIGERIAEGFGEISYRIIKAEIPKLEKFWSKIEDGDRDDKVPCVHANPGTIANELCQDLFTYYIKMSAAADVKALEPKNRMKSEAARPTVSNMLLMCRENCSFEVVENTVKDRYGKKNETKKEKLKIAWMILEQAKDKNKKLLKEFCEKYQVEQYECKLDICYLYLDAFLQQLKYSIRSQTIRKGEG